MAKAAKLSKAEKRLALAMAFRRAIINCRKREASAAVKAEAKAERSHEKAKVRRERTNKLAAEWIEGCRKYPSPHAVRQLGEITGRADLNTTNRVEAAATLLDWGHADFDPLAVAVAKRVGRPARAKVRPLAERLHFRG